jgi:U3 small nucleolar RNA-associated protein 3
MGKKKTPVFRNGADKDHDSTKGDKIDAIRTWDDVEHDSEDDCEFMKRDLDQENKNTDFFLF